METGIDHEKDKIEKAIALARVERPAYSHLYSFLEALFLARAEARGFLNITVPLLPKHIVGKKWDNGLPLLNRWDFPIDLDAAERLLDTTGTIIPDDSNQLSAAWNAIRRSLPTEAPERQEFWSSFLQHEMEPWEEWFEIGKEADPGSILFLARSAVRPSLEFTAGKLIEQHPVPSSWLKGYCPVCGSLPSLLLLGSEGERKGFCSWCATTWDLHALQCPYCNNRYHESLGYIGLEAEHFNRIVYCNLCRFYFKQLDTRELAYPPYLPLEEWTTLHMDLVAGKSGFNQPPSPAPAIYGESE
ncbi:MAG: formate dehydrogenase accessory protein FdhE [Syntrophobacteraceae bacterium]